MSPVRTRSFAREALSVGLSVTGNGTERLGVLFEKEINRSYAPLAQLVEHLSCKQKVIGSNPIGGSESRK